MRVKKEDVLFTLFCVATAVIFASYRCINGDFVAYNGDFQNYNIFRRLLAGQVQYRDFTNYLGNGMVFINFPFVYLFQGFGASVFITNFTTSIIYSFILCASFYMILHDRIKAYMISSAIAIMAFIILHAGLQGTFYYKYVYDFVFFEELGHSMRTTRAFLPFMLVGAFYVIRSKRKKKNLLLHVFQTNKLLAVIYLLMGMLTIWSNDYGYSCVICFFIIMVLINLFNDESTLLKRLSTYVIALVCAVVGALLSIAVVTHGHIAEYFQINIGITDYQFWYYGNQYGKYLTFSDIFSDDLYLKLTVLFFLHAIYFLVKTIKKELDDDCICKLFLHSTCYAASLVYVVGSGAHSYAALIVVTYILGIGVIGNLVKWAIDRCKRKEICASPCKPVCMQVKKAVSNRIRIFHTYKFTAYILAMLMLYCISVNIIRTDIFYRDKEEVQGLDVYSVIGSDLDACAEEISDGILFSTYASALEVINNVFQPSGTDYIIHVLGDEQRDQYLDIFMRGKYKYVSTLKNEYTIWEYWSSRVNWYIYRELYLHYKPVKETNYSVIWARSKEENEIKTDIQLKWEYMNESTCRIDVALPGYTDGAYVDLNIRYDTVWSKDRLKMGGMRKVLCVQDGGEQYNSYGANACYYLREQTDECNIPVYVRDGKGYAYITSYPLSCSMLTGVDVSVNTVIKEPDFPLHVTNYTDNCRMIASDSVSKDGMVLKFDNTEFATTILQDAGQLTANNETAIVDQVWRDGDYIYVSLENPVDRDNFIYPNKIKVVKRETTYTVHNYSDDEWVCGVSRKEGKILINEDIDVENLCAVKAENVKKKVISKEVTEKGYCLLLEDNQGIQVFAYPQEIELLYCQ